MRRSGGITVLMLLLLFLLLYRSREVLPREGLPAFLVDESPGIFIHLGAGFSAQEIHQFSDGITPRAVIQLTGLGERAEPCAGTSPDLPMKSGEVLEITDKSCYQRDWMPAGKRMALGILLHPDRMSREDWEALPGLGPSLAERIEMDRQINGDFESLSALERVRGIGPHRIRTLAQFFIDE